MSTTMSPTAALASGRNVLPIASARVTTTYVARQLAKRWKLTLSALLITVLWAFTMTLVPRLIGSVVELVSTGGDHVAIIWRGAAIFGVGLLTAALSALNFAQLAALGQHIVADMREEVMARVVDTPAQSMENSGIGDALSRVADDVDVAASAFSYVIPSMLSHVILIAVISASLSELHPLLLLAVLLAVPPFLLTARWYLPRTNRLYKRERLALGDRAQALLTTIKGAETVHAYGLEERQSAQVTRFSAAARDITLQIVNLVLFSTLMVRTIQMVLLGFALWLCYYLHGEGNLTIGQATSSLLLITGIFWPLQEIIWSLDQVQSAGASLTRMVGVIKDPRLAAREDDTDGPAPADSSLTLRGVSHAYVRDAQGEERIVLHPLDLDVAPGESIALVGTSGAGKTTLGAIMTGALTPSHGSVAWGGVELSEMATEQRRSFASIISQETHVFMGTLADDLRLVREDASEAQLREALAQVGADTWVRALPDGLATQVGEKGHRLTPEQTQHLALARIALQDPRVLVMDEATADEGGNATGERPLDAAADSLREGRTTVIVAHRLSQAARADRILVLSQGRIVEQGSHDKLLEQGGRYAELWRAWSA
ncbi:ABC transporter ATP-binding protein [Dermabacteraceae bacterium P13136]